MGNKPKTLYGNSRELLEAAERKNELLAQIAGETYTNEGNPASLYGTDKALLAAAQKENELLEAIAEVGGGGANKISIDYATDVISLKKGEQDIPDSGATLPAYGLSYDSGTGGLTLTKNGTAMSGQTVALPPYGAPNKAESAEDMTDTDKVYVYVGETTAALTNGDWYVYDAENEEWVSGGVYNASAIVTDTTLAVEGAAADAKVTGNRIGALDDALNHSLVPEYGAIHVADITNHKYIRSSDGQENSGNSNKYAHTELIDVDGLVCAVEVKSAVYDYWISYYGENGYIYDPVQDYKGWSEVISANSGIFRLPVGTKKIALTFRSAENISDEELPTIAASVILYEYSGAVLEEHIADFNAFLTDANRYAPLDFNVTWGAAVNGRYGGITSGTSENYGYTNFVDVSAFEAVLYRRTATTGSTATNNIGMAFYSTSEDAGFITGNLGAYRHTQFKYLDEMELIYVPKNARYARFTVLKNTVAYGEFKLYGIPKVENIPIGMHTMPQNSGAYNAIRKARQNSDVRWTPAMDIPRACIAMRTYNLDNANARTYVEDKFAEGTEYTGIPYSTTVYYGPGKYLMSERPLETFLSSVLSADSAEGELSSYAEETHDYGSYYGNNCTSMLNYAIHHPHVASNYASGIDGMDMITSKIVKTLSRLDLGLLRLGDMLSISTHVGMVTDIIRGADKTVTAIEVTEQTRGGMMNMGTLGGKYGGKARRLFWSADDFYSHFGDYAVYRYLYLDHVGYVPSPYVPMADEGETYDCYDYPLLPYYGNKVLLTSGATCKLLVRTDGFTHVFVRKNGAEWNEDGTTDPYALNGADYIEIACDSDEAVYTAVLGTIKNGSIFENTVECTWFVEGTPSVEATVIPKEESGLTYDQIAFTVGMKTGEFAPWYTNLTTPEVGGSFYLTGNRMLFDDVTSTYDDTAAYPYIYEFTIPIRNSVDPADPTNYRVGMWSDKFGAMYIDGTF